MRTESKAVLVWVVLSAIWGSTWLFMKLGLEDLPPFSFAGLRFAVAVVPLAILVTLRRRPLPRGRADWSLMVGTGLVIFALNYGLVFWSQQHISSGLGALLYSTFPLFGLFMAHFHLPAEPLTKARLAGALLGATGVGVVFSNQLAVRGPWALAGAAAVVVAAGASAWADILIKKHAGHIDPAQLTLVQMGVSVPILLGLGAVVEGNPLALRFTPMALVATAYLALFGSALAFVLLYWLIRNMDVTLTMLITLAIPMIAVILGVVILGERVTWQMVAGGAAILGGLALVLWEQRARRRARAAPGDSGAAEAA